MFSRKNNVAVMLLSVMACVSVPVLSDSAGAYNQLSSTYQQIQDVNNCTVGDSILQAQQVHMKLASAKPNTEALFAVGNDCFSGLTKLLDLSIAIPSLGSIMGAVGAALLEYGHRKVCTAVLHATSMVTSPINMAIQDVNGLLGMQSIDSALGSSYQGNTQTGYYDVGFSVDSNEGENGNLCSDGSAPQLTQYTWFSMSESGVRILYNTGSSGLLCPCQNPSPNLIRSGTVEYDCFDP